MRSFLDMIRRSPKGDVLRDMHALIDWSPIEVQLKKVLKSSKMGRSSYAPLKMFKILLIQRFYDLSDPQMEHQLYDRLSFRSFCDFGFSECLPDETTICRFRNSLVGGSEALFEIVLSQLDTKGYVLRKGTLVDATIIESSAKTPPAKEQSETDPEAGWTKKRGEFTYGYKAHVGVDEGSGLVVKVKLTSANFHDSQVFHHVVTGEEDAVYADKAYDSKAIRDMLKEADITDRIVFKKKKGKKLRHILKVLNRLYSRVRSGVERIFAHFKGQHGYVRARYKGWDKNQNHLNLMAIMYNMKRAVALSK